MNAQFWCRNNKIDVKKSRSTRGDLHMRDVIPIAIRVSMHVVVIFDLISGSLDCKPHDTVRRLKDLFYHQTRSFYLNFRVLRPHTIAIGGIIMRRLHRCSLFTDDLTVDHNEARSIYFSTFTN